MALKTVVSMLTVMILVGKLGTYEASVAETHGLDAVCFPDASGVSDCNDGDCVACTWKGFVDDWCRLDYSAASVL